MTRSNITVEALIAKGYSEYEFSDYTLEKAVGYIKNGCSTRLEPRANGTMAAIVVVKCNGHTYELDMFWRNMTVEEKETYAETIAELQKKEEEFIKKASSRNRARMIRGCRR